MVRVVVNAAAKEVPSVPGDFFGTLASGGREDHAGGGFAGVEALTGSVERSAGLKRECFERLEARYDKKCLYVAANEDGSIVGSSAE